MHSRILSYNFGLANGVRVRAAARIALMTAVGCGAGVSALFVFVPEGLVGLFLPGENRAAQLAVAGFPLFAAGFIPFVVNLSAIGCYQSLERVRPATAFALLRGCVLLVPSFLLLPELCGVAGIWFAQPLSETLTTVFILLYFRLHRPRR